METNVTHRPRMYTTAEAAELERSKSATWREDLSRKGHHKGIVPVKLPGGRLLWPADEVDRLVSGESTDNARANPLVRKRALEALSMIDRDGLTAAEHAWLVAYMFAATAGDAAALAAVCRWRPDDANSATTAWAIHETTGTTITADAAAHQLADMAAKYARRDAS